MKKLTKTILAALCVSTLLAFVSSATIHNFTISLDPSQVVTSSVTSSGSGSGTASYDDATGVLVWEFSVSGLTGSVVDADFHAPAAAGATAPKVIDAFAGYVGNSGTGTGNGPGNTTIYTPAADLLNNLWYLTIATNAYPTSSGQDGEIRGQLIRVVAPPAPPALDYSLLIAKRVKQIKLYKKRLKNASGKKAKRLKKKFRRAQNALKELLESAAGR